MRTLTIPRYTATDVQVEAVKRESMARFGIPYQQAVLNAESSLMDTPTRNTPESTTSIPAFEIVPA